MSMRAPRAALRSGLKTNMALGAGVKRHFPMRKVDDVVEFFRAQLESDNEPDLALLSIVIGYIENLLTFHRNVEPASGGDQRQPCFPVVEIGPIEALHAKFACQIKGSLDLSAIETDSPAGMRDLIKRVSDAIWSSLTRSYYKDRPHLQSLYSYLTGNKLDCFGVAFAVVAACQALGFPDVHLALSEDHAWVIFEEREETAEVTWHGKGNEDRRGQPIPQDKSWLYLNGHAIPCTRATEVAALVSAINPTITPTTDSTELVNLQQQLLWLLYDKGHLRNYPMALGNLGELEGLFPTPGRPPPQDLFAEAVHASRTYYQNHHVYPYTYLGGFLFRNGRLKEALRAWADAADVIRKFNYGREDEEIYKEFMEIANELVPQLVKLSSTGDSSLLQDPSCFAHLLRFYDGLCAWEEGSATPVLHIGWARPLVGTIAKFPASVRAAVSVHASTGDEEEEASEQKNHKDAPPSISKEHSKKSSETSSQDSLMADGKEPKEEDFLKSLENQLGQSNGPPHPDIVALAAACAENILNPDYLLGCGEPFSTKNGNNGKSGSRSSGDGGAATVTLSSQKMAGLKDLLLAEKLNTSAIQLQLTAQSQVQVVKRGQSNPAGGPHEATTRHSKRMRRE
ncbi:menin isoform X2 [Dermacentor silvarum]|uniref:menin isoform X2 n=1 Tax=Dermacentor silvarum TaxID=543639 RepID=UPI00189AD13C|nr:menin isoform X2 [Dermacentor silvarum]